MELISKTYLTKEEKCQLEKLNLAALTIQSLWKNPGIKENKKEKHDLVMIKIIAGDLENVERMILRYSYLKNYDCVETNWSLLMTAAMYDQYKMVKLLLKLNCNITKIEKGRSALTLVLHADQYETAGEIIDTLSKQITGNKMSTNKLNQAMQFLKHAEQKRKAQQFEFQIKTLQKQIWKQYAKKSKTAVSKFKKIIRKK